MISLTDYTLAEILLIVGCVIVLCFLLSEACDWSKLVSFNDVLNQYGYEAHNGPHTWKCNYPDSKGNLQSPINIYSKCAVCVPGETDSPIKFSFEYYTVPNCMVLSNDSHSVVLYARWDQDAAPTVSGGPLCHSYQFVGARFRWGPSDNEGTEHTINNNRYGLEVQATHVKPEFRKRNLCEALKAQGVVILSYLYKVTHIDNPYLEVIINALDDIQCPSAQSHLEEMPLSWVTPPFTSKYFTYQGSLTYPPCTEGVTWIIQPEPLNISSRQLKKFRKLMTLDGLMLSNCRPVQRSHNRDTFYYD